MYKFREMEPKWQKIWEKEKAFEAINESKKPKYYYLIEFPYPSGSKKRVPAPFIPIIISLTWNFICISIVN